MADETQQPAPGTTPDITPDKGEGKTPGSDNQGDKGTFTQADLDRHIKERLTRDREAREKEFLTTYGVNSRDELKTALEAARKIEADNLTEAQRSAKALEKMKDDHDLAQRELLAEREARKQEKLDAAVRAAAKGAHDPDDVVKLLRDTESDALTKAMNAEGVIETKVLDTLIADLKKKKGYLFGGNTPGSPSNSGGKAPDVDAKLKDQARQALKRQIRPF